MAICKKCGATIDESAKFCPGCGTRIDEKTSSNTKERETFHIVAKTVTQEDLQNMAFSQVNSKIENRNFSTVGSAINRVESVDDREANDALFSYYRCMIRPVQQFEGLMQQRNSLENDLVTEEEKNILMIFPILCIACFIILIVETTLVEDKGATNLPLLIYRSSYVFGILPGILKYIGGIFLTPVMDAAIITFILNHLYYSSRSKQREDLKKQVAAMDARVNAAVEKMTPYLMYIPRNYRNSIALSYFVECYENSRVDNLKEAVNLFDTYEDRQIAREQRAETNAMLRNIEDNSRYIADNIASLRADIWASSIIF